jgi:hypothetical protein
MPMQMQIRACAYWFLALGLCVGVVATTHAEDSETSATQGDATTQPVPPSDQSAVARPWAVGLLLGYGFDLRNPFNMWGLGLGLRGGYNLGLGPIYIGGRFVYQFGDSRQDEARGQVIRDFSWHHWDLGVEGGYDVSVADQLIVRPELGLGFVGFTASLDDKANSLKTSDTTLYAYFALGGTLLYDLAPNVFIGANVRLQIVVGGGATEAFTFMLHGGMRL